MRRHCDVFCGNVRKLELLLFFGWWKSRGCEEYYVSNKIHSSSLFVDEAIYLIALAIPWVGTFPQRTIVMNWLMIYFISSSSWFSAHFVCLVCLACLASAHFVCLACLVCLGSHLYYIQGCYYVTAAWHNVPFFASATQQKHIMSKTSKNHLKNYLKASQHISMYVHSRIPSLFSRLHIPIYRCNVWLSGVLT